MQEFFAMGGYAAYVWSAFGLTLVVIVWNIAGAKAYHSGALRTARRRLNMDKTTDEDLT